LRSLALSVDGDDAGARIDSTIGNLLCRIESTGEGTPLFFCAHLDTVPPEGPIEPVVDDGIVRNSGGTILGADNKAAVASMLEATRRIVAENRSHGGIELLFTPKEEVGLRGAAAFDQGRLRAKLGYVYDHAGPIGEVILGAPYQCKLDASFHGRAAHSGMFPEEGRSGIAAAALERSGIRPSYGLSGGGADANVFNERGLQCLNLANGMTDIHTPDERIAVADLERMVDVTLALVEVARDAS